MNRIAFSFACITLAVTSFSEETPTIPVPSREQFEKQQQFQEKMAKRTGGRLLKPGSLKGSIAIVNVQKRVPVDSYFKTFRKEVSETFGIDIKSVTESKPVTVAEAERRVADTGSNLAVFVVEDPDYPPMLIAPESRWAIVNVTALAKDGAQGEKLAERTRRELYRAFLSVSGGFASQFPNNVMVAASLKELDQIKEAFIPVDFQQRIETYLPKLGVTPAKYVTYVRACREGWAPQPTNEYQKAIWDKVHEIPSKPLKIEYNEKRDKGK